MINTIKSFAKILFILDAVLIVFSFFQDNEYFLINTQVAFVSSLFISLGTFLSYRNNVSKRLDGLEENKNNLGQRDTLDELDDPYDLYSEEIIHEDKELSAQEIKNILKFEKENIKKNTFKNTLFSSGAYISAYRIFGYALLIIGFFYLNNNIIFSAYAYLIGLTIMPISALFLSLSAKEKKKP
ncbi:MAG: hypothetical protein HRT41_03345 [Campylobacteraceae bacterium]|nr:hypothetical protein [Campylobacteraceae bacterium]